MKKKATDDKLDKLDVLISQVDKKYGKGTIIRASEYPALPRISTGIFSLDMEIGGGLPKGRMILFTGNESTAKSTTAQLAIVQFQKTCRNCAAYLVDDECPNCGEDGGPHKAVYLDIEGTFDPVWFSVLGGNNRDLFLIQPDFAEQSADIIEALIRTGEIDVIVVDSLAMMAPAIEIEKSAEDALVGNTAKLLNRMVRAISSGINSLGMMNVRKPSIILINQIREKVGVMYGNPETIPGGRGQRHAVSIHVKFFARPSEEIYETIGEKKSVGQQFRFSVIKNKTFPPHREGIFTMYTDNSEEYGVQKGSLDNLEQIVRYGIRYKVIVKSGTWLSYKNEKHNELKAQGESSFLALLDDHPEVVAEIKQKVSTQVFQTVQNMISGAVTQEDENISDIL